MPPTLTGPVVHGVSRFGRATLFVLLAGSAFLGALLCLTPEGVVTSGDGGMKLLLTRQIAAGDARPDLVLPAPAWALQLWNDGLDPLEPPFALRAADGRRFIGFPVPFAYASAPGLRAFGFAGTLLLPAAATLALWLTFVAACRRLRLGRGESAAALSLLIFGTPVSVYGAVFWEHAPAVALAFAGSVLLLRPGARAVAVAPAAAAGLLVGLSVWMREELLALGVVLALWTLLPARFGWWGRAPAPRARAALLLGLTLPLVAYLAMNAAIYGTLAGVRALQLHGDVVGDRLRSAPGMLAALSWAFARSFPLVGLAAVWPFTARALRLRLPRWALHASALGLAFLLAVSPLPVNDGGKQFGPRYVLLLFPLGALVMGAVLRALRRAAPGVGGRLMLAGAAVLALAAGVQGLWLGPRALANALLRRTQTVERLRADPHAVVAVSNTQVTQQLAWLADRKLFFRVQRAADFKRLATALEAQGLPAEFTYLCHPGYRCQGFGDQPATRVWRLASGARLVARRRDDAGAYRRYDVRLER